MSTRNFIQKFIDKVDSGSNVIWVYLTGDEGRAERTIHQIAAVMSGSGPITSVSTWDRNAGATWIGDSQDPIVAMQAVDKKLKRHSLLIFRDVHLLLNAQQNYQVRRQLIELCKNNTLSNKDNTRPIIILADTPTPHADIRDYCDVIDYELPDYEEMKTDVVEYTQNSISEANAADTDSDLVVPDLGEDEKDKITYALLGMSGAEATRVLSFAAATCGGLQQLRDVRTEEGAFRPGVLSVIADEKASVVRKVDGLTYIPHKDIPPMSDFGGFDLYQVFIRKRARGYSSLARRIGMRKPRGCVLLGPPGTGKTMVAMATALELGLDLIQMDIGSLFDSLVGSSEKKVRTAINMIDAMQSCVLMVDEIDKAFAGALGASDSGVSSRILSYFLNWLSNRSLSATSGSRIFVLVTMNRTAGVPPEMIRMGRFDRVFSTDLPDTTERVDILKIHMRKNGIDADQYGKGLKDLARHTDKWAGGELEELVITAQYDAFDRVADAWESAGSPTSEEPTLAACQPTMDDYLAAATLMVPLAVTEEDAIDEMRKFCRERTTPVSGRRTHDAPGTRKSRGVRTSRSQPSEN